MKRGTLLKVRHDGTALLIHSFSSHISSQGMGCAIAATVSAGMAGQGTLVKSGWELSTEENRTLGLETRGLAARSDQGAPLTINHQADKTSQPGKQQEEGEDMHKHRCNSAYH